MNDNIQITNKNGDMMNVEGISYIQIQPSNKKYLFYTLNEKVDNDLTKIYISEVDDTDSGESINGVNGINDVEWDDLRQKMIKISHKENVENVSFLSMNDVKFNVGDPKKLAITAVAKQAFKDAQLSNTMSTNQTATPVTTGSSSPFFNQEVVEPQTNSVETDPVEQNIFSNPPQPEITTTSNPAAPTNELAVPTLDATTPASTPLNSEIVTTPEDNPTLAAKSSIPSIETPTPPKTAINQQSAMELTMSLESAAPTMPNIETPLESTTPISNASAFNTTEQVQEIPAPPIASNELSQTDNKQIVEELSNSSSEKQIITDEEALKAINTIQEYINQESENNNQ